MTQPPASVRDVLLELLAAVGDPPYRSARLLRAVERAHKALGHAPEPERDEPILNLMGLWEKSSDPILAVKGLCENCDDPILVEFRYDTQLYLCDSCYAFQLHETESQP